MKNFKKIAIVLLVMALVLSFAFAAFACDNAEQNAKPEQQNNTQTEQQSNTQNTDQTQQTETTPQSGEATDTKQTQTQVATLEVGKVGTVALVVAPATEGGEATEYLVATADLAEIKTALAFMEYLKTNKGLTYTTDDTGYGAFLTQVDGLTQNAANSEYIYLYTSVAKDADVSAYATEITYKEHTLPNAGVGISSMSIEDGAIIYIGIVKW